MAILKIAKMGHPILLQKAKKVDDPTDPKIKTLVNDMLETLDDLGNGVGLAAPQVHLSKRIIIFRNPDVPESNKIQITPLINPTFEPLSDDKEDGWEGCLSIPGITEEILRPKVIKVVYQDINGVLRRNTYDELWSTCFQHELDHLNGKLFIDHLRPMKRILVKNKIKKSSKREKKV